MLKHWFIFGLSHCSDVCCIILHYTALKWHWTVLWELLFKPRLHSGGFRAGCTRLDDPCTAGSTTLPRPGTSVPRRKRPGATAWRFSTGSEFFSWGKYQSRFFLSGAQTCLFVSWRPWLWHERDKASHNRDRAGEKSVCFWGRLS